MEYKEKRSVVAVFIPFFKGRLESISNARGSMEGIIRGYLESFIILKDSYYSYRLHVHEEGYLCGLPINRSYKEESYRGILIVTKETHSGIKVDMEQHDLSLLEEILPQPKYVLPNEPVFA